MPFDSEFGQYKEKSSLSRVLGPEHIDFEGDITSHEAIQKLLRGEGKTSPTETVLDKESAEIRELLKRIFDKLKASIFACNSRPELEAIFAAVHRVQQFPLPQLNRDSGEFDGLMNRHGNLEVGPVDVKLFRFLIVNELAHETLTPQVREAWSEFEAVWEKIHLTAPGMAVEGMAKAVAPFEAQQMNEVIELVRERATAMESLDGLRRVRTAEAQRAVETLAQGPQVLDWTMLEELIYYRLAGEWRETEGEQPPLTQKLQRLEGHPRILAKVVEELAKEKDLPDALVSKYLNYAMDVHTRLKTVSPFLTAYAGMLDRARVENSKDLSEFPEEEQEKIRKGKELHDKHLRLNEVYTLSDGTLWYYGKYKGVFTFLPVVQGKEYEDVGGDRSRWYFYGQAIEERVVSKTKEELSPRIHDAVAKEAWKTLLQLSGQDTTEGFIQWLETETQRVESWVAAGAIPPELVETLKDTPRESLWHIESDVIQYRSILQGKRSALNVSPLIMEWQSRVFLMRDRPGNEPEKLTLRYLRLMHLLREMLQYDESELQTILPQDLSPHLITSDLMDKIFSITKGDRAPLVQREWNRE